MDVPMLMTRQHLCRSRSYPKSTLCKTIPKIMYVLCLGCLVAVAASSSPPQTSHCSTLDGGFQQHSEAAVGATAQTLLQLGSSSDRQLFKGATDESSVAASVDAQHPEPPDSHSSLPVVWASVLSFDPACEGTLDMLAMYSVA
eukprot:4906587-Amphidinium_carterae.1